MDLYVDRDDFEYGGQRIVAILSFRSSRWHRIGTMVLCEMPNEDLVWFPKDELRVY